MKVNKFPTLILFRDNDEIWRFEGLMDEKKHKKVTKILKDTIS